MDKCVIVIPIHNANPSPNELISFRQCFRILQHHSIRILAPEKLSLEKYKKVVSAFDVIFIDDVWQSSLLQYNKLKASYFFYDLFSHFDFLLTYELDAWVFKDEIECWCGKGYDYIGAPWLEGWDLGNSTKIIGVGNSGFSLRNIKTCLRILRRIDFLKKVRTFWFKSHLQALWRFHKMPSPIKKYFHILSLDELNKYLVENIVNEDGYWSKMALVFSDYKVAPAEDAIKFSFEVNPVYLFKENNNQLPFGCHAWEKYQPEFWKSFINLTENINS